MQIAHKVQRGLAAKAKRFKQKRQQLKANWLKAHNDTMKNQNTASSDNRAT